MWYSGRKARKEGGKIKRWDKHTGFFLSRTFVSSSGQWQKKIVFFSKTFLPMMLTHTRGVSKCLLLTSQTIDLSFLSFLFPLPHNVIAFFGGLGDKTAKQPGNLMWGFGLFLQCLSRTWGHAAVEQLLPETPPPHPLEISLVTCHDLHDYPSWGQIYPRKTHFRI